MIVNDEWERMWKEAVVAQLKVLPVHLPGWTKENPRKTLIRTVSVPAEFRTYSLPNTS
jgi:hypothetical protein